MPDQSKQHPEQGNPNQQNAQQQDAEQQNETDREQDTNRESKQGAPSKPPHADKIQVDTKRAAVGGVLAAVVTLVGAWLVGEASGAEAHRLVETALDSTRSFCGTVTLALGNILALMLTLLSLSASADVDLEWSHYQRVKQIAWIDTVTLIASICIYLFLNFPLGESDTTASEEKPDFTTLYYALLVSTSLLAGALISIALMLFNTVRDIIRVVGGGEKANDLPYVSNTS